MKIQGFSITTIDDFEDEILELIELANSHDIKVLYIPRTNEEYTDSFEKNVGPFIIEGWKEFWSCEIDGKAEIVLVRARA